MEFNEDDFDLYFSTIHERCFSHNDGGMKSVDMFSLYYILKQLRPEFIIES